MTKKVELTMVPKNRELWTSELADLVKRCYKNKPAKGDLNALRERLEETPDLYQVVFDLAEVIQDKTIEEMFDNQTAARIGIRANIETLRDGMGYHTAPTVEKLMIENISLAWLRYQWSEFQLTVRMSGDVSMSVVTWWEKRTSAAQRRYLRAIETLARVRKLARNTPALQVNIATEGGQQVNVGGDLNNK